MRRKHLLFLISVLMVSCFLSAVTIMGDSPKCYEINSINALELLQARNDINQVLLVSQDTLAVLIDQATWKQLRFKAKNKRIGCYSDALPPTVKIADIRALVLQTDFVSAKLSLLDGLDDEQVVTPFQAFLSQYRYAGDSYKNGYHIKKYLYRGVFQQHFIDNHTLALFKDGRSKTLGMNDHILFTDFSFRVDKDTLVALWDNAPEISSYLINNEINQLYKQSAPVLVLFIDGLGYQLYQNAKAHKFTAFLDSVKWEPVRSAYPPQTKYVYWAIGSGKTKGELSQTVNPTIFEEIRDTTALIVEADTKFYNSPIKQILNIDTNRDGSIDDEIFDCTEQEMMKGHSFLFVHFHSIDDVSHQNGPYSERTMQQVQRVANWVELLSKQWKGRVYLFSDHGQHNSFYLGGTHGIACVEDIISLRGYYK